MIETVKEKIKNIFLTYFVIFIPMWLIFIINNGLMINSLNSFGIKPRNVNFIEIIAVMFSWTLHANFNHILNNSLGLVGLLFFVSLLENKIFHLLFLLILTSGFSTWLLGSDNSIHIGASGLVFALFGYVLSASTLGRKWLYFIPVSLAFFFYGFAYYEGFINGLILKDGVSLAAHFGGLVSGIFVGIYFQSIIKEDIYSYRKKLTIKEWLNESINKLKNK
ncbi:rhomboid family intramembrane serine protease [archaeon]|nr:rhomboid family intramembrane serine protease [archaeon]NCQ51965.1 rhomboid family intramembrane serine protease [archaeon]